MAAGPREVVELINRRHGTALTLKGRAPGGESVPWIVTDQEGVEYLLKWADGGEARVEPTLGEIIERLSAAGYPVPKYLFTGRDGHVSYAVRAMLPGAPLAAPQQPLDARYLPRLLELNDLQRDAARGIANRWPELLIESITRGFGDWCVLESLARYSAETASMLRELQTMAIGLDLSGLATHDAVHFDFNGSNILVSEGVVTAVIDCEGFRPGDRAFDLVTLLFYEYLNPSARRALGDRLRAITSEAALKLYFAHMVVRQLDWSIRKHPQPAIDHFLKISRALLDDLRR